MRHFINDFTIYIRDRRITEKKFTNTFKINKKIFYLSNCMFNNLLHHYFKKLLLSGHGNCYHLFRDGGTIENL